MNKFESAIELETEKIRIERESYPAGKYNASKKFFDYASLIFLASGFIALVLIFFTDVTLLQAACLFVISYVISPTDGDRYESQIKCMAEDLANIRINTTVIGKHINNGEKHIDGVTKP